MQHNRIGGAWVVLVASIGFGSGCGTSTETPARSDARPAADAPPAIADAAPTASPDATHVPPPDAQPEVSAELIELWSTPDFTPASGASPNPTGNPIAEGPWNGRFMEAVSDNGLEFTKTGRIIGDQLNVPDLVYGPGGYLFLYCIRYVLGDDAGHATVAISPDHGVTWVFKDIDYGSDYPLRDAADPSAFYLPATGTFRLYVTYSAEGENNSTYYAESSDGVNFADQGKAFGRNDENAIVPSVLRVGSEWHLYANTHDVTIISHAVSSDGMSFTLERELQLQIGDINYFAGNAVPIADGYRLYAYARDSAALNIGSFRSPDGVNWNAEGVRLPFEPEDGLESNLVKDPGVIQRPDGSYLMIYSTQVPE